MKFSFWRFSLLALFGGLLTVWIYWTPSSQAKEGAKASNEKSSNKPLVSAPSVIEFDRRWIALGGKKLHVEVADTRARVERGLMYRARPLNDNEGMLFEFSDEKPRTFWMKNTFIPLSIGFFDKNKALVSIRKMSPVRSEMEKPKSYGSGKPAKYALEVSQGWFERHQVKPGARFEQVPASR